MTDGIGAEMVRLQMEVRDHRTRSEDWHREALDGIAKVELGLATALECLARVEEILSREPEAEPEAEPEGEPEGEGEAEGEGEGEEVTEIDGEPVIEVEPEAESEAEVAAEMLVEDAVENLQTADFGPPFRR